MAVFSVIKRVNSSREAMTRSICAKKVGGVSYNGEYFHQYKNFRGLRAWGRSACVKKVGGIDFRRRKPPKIGIFLAETETVGHHAPAA